MAARRPTPRHDTTQRHNPLALALFLAGAASIALTAWRVEPFASAARNALGGAGHAVSAAMMATGSLALVGVRRGLVLWEMTSFISSWTL